MKGWNFCSDNVAGAAPEILQALTNAGAAGAMMPYGADPLTARVEKRLAEIFETDLAVHFVATGTAANALSLAAMCPPYGAVYCHRDSHVNVDECGAPEFFTGGAKLVALDGPDGKLDAAGLAAALDQGWAGIEHHVQPAAVSLTQSSEAGTVYRLDEIAAISELCRSHGLGLHIDGARFANALVALGCSPADATWRAGVDALSFGATKNGALAAEAVLFFRPGKLDELRFRRKRAGHLFSKMRFLSAQLDAYLADDLWLGHARHANAMAARLAAGLGAIKTVDFLYRVEANELFVSLPAAIRDGLAADEFAFYPWIAGGPDCIRLVTAFDTPAAAVDAFIASARRHAP
ncbi:MAG: Low specificity L-threonine aldolase [Alphaproteobacteria bacterium MarineAlpha10_Bin3]|jgi:threonine aldolase|nr:MAG: Low specificity L-threonine aldolase [Alphaproteobacteria bacterium MarineAlpha10_Bin3]PPR71317.1 MAG: Low specificity L-threonine aldolase [Alphaproteobacteria bacterium MarineAlpha4_Bin1]